MSAGLSSSTERKPAELPGRLRREYAASGVPAAEVQDVIAVVRAGLAGATVLTYLPVLVERGARDRLGCPRPPSRATEPVTVERVGARTRTRESVVRTVGLRVALWGPGVRR